MSDSELKPEAILPLNLTHEAREMLRQLLRVPALEEASLISAVKEALHKQYSRGFQEGVVEGARGSQTTDASKLGERRKLSPAHDSTRSSRERRQHRRAQRMRTRIRNALTTMVLLVLAGGALLAFNAVRPELSANNQRARHRIEWGK